MISILFSGRTKKPLYKSTVYDIKNVFLSESVVIIVKKRFIPAALLLLLCAILLFACEKTESPAVSAVEPSADALDPCVLIDFTGKQAQTLLTAAQIGSDDYSFTKNGLLISGKQKSVRDGVYTIAGTFDFGSVQSDAPVCRMMIDGLSKIGTNVSIKLYLDGQDTPFIEKRLNMQSQKKVWDERNPVFCELSEPIWGVHTIRFTVEDVSSGRDEKTAALIRGFRFYRQSGLEYIRGRGESTWEQAKKPYKIKLEDKANLFGMGSSKNWALIANYFDGSFVRNRITYYLGEAIGLRYTPKLVPVEVVINGEYNGLYYLSETVRMETSRLGIDNLDDFKAGDGNITGGYLISACRKWDADGYLFETRRRSDMQIVSPEEIDDKTVPAETLQQMYDYMVDYYQKTEDAVFGEGGKNADGVHYTELMDLDSTARYYLIQEFCMNRDAYHTDSTYLYKERDGKLYWGPLWDFDLCAWGGDAATTYLQDGDIAAMATEDFYQAYSWIRALRGDPLFVEAVQKAWGGKDSTDPTTLRYQLMEIVKDGGLLDQYEAELAPATDANADLPGYAYLEVYDFAAEFDQPRIGTDFHSEMYRLKRWITDWIAWMDAHMEELYDPTARVQLTFVSDSETVATVSAINGDPVFGFPTPEPREGLYFVGWYADKEGYDEETDESVMISTRFDNGSTLFEDTVFTAKWVSAEDVILPEAIYLERSETYLRVDKSIEFHYTVTPEGACDSVFITSSDPWKGYVDQYGTLTVFDMTGDITIIVETINGLKAEYLLHIIPSEEQEEAAYKAGTGEEPHSDFIYYFAVEEPVITMKPGEYRKIDLLFEPEDAVRPDFRILNANESIAYLTPEGVLVARSEGVATIFIVNDRKEDAVQLTVTVSK